MPGSIFEYRQPIDLANPKLRRLAAALAPAYVRVSGTWRNSTFFQDNDQPVLKEVPDGYKGIMTRAQWKGVIDFSKSVDAQVVASVATSQGARDAESVWTSTQAKAFFDYTKAIGGKIVATEFMNEPTFAAVGGAPVGYNAGAFAKDIKLFNEFLRRESPGTLFLGPGSIGEGAPMIEGAPSPKVISTEEMLKGTGPFFDAFSYHFYSTISRRCTGPMGPNVGVNADRALGLPFLEKQLTVERFYSALRDQYLPGKPIWNTETGEAGCGGDPWASTFTDTFRFMDQLGALAQKSVHTVIVNTLASSDYGMLDEETLEPRPDYWAALLWKRTMGTRVLDPGPAPVPSTRIYAQCMKGSKGGVTLLVLNLSRTDAQTLQFPQGGKRFTLSANDMLSHAVSLNGTALKAASDGSVPSLEGRSFKAGALTLAPVTISFLELPAARNAACIR
jgi:hypothetical protein